MSGIAKQDITISAGKTFQQVVRWESPPILYVKIAAITQSAPVEVTTQVPHGIPEGWRIAFESVKGMTQINSTSSPPKDKDYHQATVTGASTFEVNDINSIDFKAHTANSGVVRMNTPVNLTGFTARMTMRDKVGGTEILSLTTENSRITLDSVNATITLFISATDTASITILKGVYDLEMVSSTGVVTALLAGKVTVEQEVTT